VAKVKQRKASSDRDATREAPSARRASTPVSTSRKRPRARGAARGGAAEVVSVVTRGSAPSTKAARGAGARRVALAKATRPAARTAATAGAAQKGRAHRGGTTAAKGAAGTSRKASATVLAKRGTPVSSARRAARSSPVPDRVVKIKQLDPFEKCGPSTSVEHLYRVDETLDGSAATHLVFFDRHGWYCEHGRSCRAVDDVRKLGKSVVGKSSVRTITVG